MLSETGRTTPRARAIASALIKDGLELTRPLRDTSFPDLLSTKGGFVRDIDIPRFEAPEPTISAAAIIESIEDSIEEPEPPL
jgi:hypothetical protein